MDTTNKKYPGEHYMIRGREKGKRGGAFQGFYKDTGKPAFGGANLFYAPIWWNSKQEIVQSVCDKIMKDFPEFECEPERIN